MHIYINMHPTTANLERGHPVAYQSYIIILVVCLHSAKQ